MVEVLHQPEAQHLGRTDCDVRVAREVRVDLHGEADRREQQGRPGRVVDIAVHRVHVCRHAVGDDDLEEQAPRDELEAGRHPAVVKPMVRLELGQEVLRPFNRSCDQLWKEDDEQRVGDEVPLCLEVATVHVNQVAHRLKGIEGDADWQGERGKRQSGHSRKPVVVLEEEEDREVQDEGGGEEEPLPARIPLHAEACEVGDDDGRKDKREVGGLPAGVEIQARGQQEAPCQRIVPDFPSKEGIADAHYGKENQELHGIERQLLHSSASCKCIRRSANCQWTCSETRLVSSQVSKFFRLTPCKT